MTDVQGPQIEFINKLKSFAPQDVVNWAMKNLVPIIGIVGVQVAWEMLHNYLTTNGYIGISMNSKGKMIGNGVKSALQIGIGVSSFK